MNISARMASERSVPSRSAVVYTARSWARIAMPPASPDPPRRAVELLKRWTRRGERCKEGRGQRGRAKSRVKPAAAAALLTLWGEVGGGGLHKVLVHAVLEHLRAPRRLQKRRRRPVVVLAQPTARRAWWRGFERLEEGVLQAEGLDDSSADLGRGVAASPIHASHGSPV